MVFEKLQNLVVQQAQAAAFKETANNQTSSDHEELEPILVRSPRSLPAAAEVPATIVTSKGHKRKRQGSERKIEEVATSTAIDKSSKRRKQNSKIQDIH